MEFGCTSEAESQCICQTHMLYASRVLVAPDPQSRNHALTDHDVDHFVEVLVAELTAYPTDYQVHAGGGQSSANDPPMT